MHAPAWVNKELALINEDYFVVFDPLENPVDHEGLWVIRKWKFKNPISRQLHSWRYNSTLIQVACREDLQTGRKFYIPINMAHIHAMREGFHNARHAAEVARRVDAYNQRLEEQAKEEEDYQHRQAAKSIWHHYKEPTVYLGS